MTRQIIILFFALIVIISFSNCNSTIKEVSEDKTNKRNFADFLHKFKILDLPFKYRPESLVDVDLKRIDSLETRFNQDELAMYYGILADTTNFYSIITLLPGDDYVPVLTTYDKQGNFIDSKSVFVNGCGGGPCIDYCSSTSIIDKDLVIYCTDTLIGPSCDNSDNPIAGTDSIFTTFIKGKIDGSGKITLDKEIRSQIKK